MIFPVKEEEKQSIYNPFKVPETFTKATTPVEEVKTDKFMDEVVTPANTSSNKSNTSNVFKKTTPSPTVVNNTPLESEQARIKREFSEKVSQNIKNDNIAEQIRLREIESRANFQKFVGVGQGVVNTVGSVVTQAPQYALSLMGGDMFRVGVNTQGNYGLYSTADKRVGYEDTSKGKTEDNQPVLTKVNPNPLFENKNYFEETSDENILLGRNIGSIGTSFGIGAFVGGGMQRYSFTQLIDNPLPAEVVKYTGIADIDEFGNVKSEIIALFDDDSISKTTSISGKLRSDSNKNYGKTVTVGKSRTFGETIVSDNIGLIDSVSKKTSGGTDYTVFAKSFSQTGDDIVVSGFGGVVSTVDDGFGIISGKTSIKGSGKTTPVSISIRKAGSNPIVNLIDDIAPVNNKFGFADLEGFHESFFPNQEIPLTQTRGSNPRTITPPVKNIKIPTINDLITSGGKTLTKTDIKTVTSSISNVLGGISSETGSATKGITSSNIIGGIMGGKAGSKTKVKTTNEEVSVFDERVNTEINVGFGFGDSKPPKTSNKLKVSVITKQKIKVDDDLDDDTDDDTDTGTDDDTDDGEDEETITITDTDTGTDDDTDDGVNIFGGGGKAPNPYKFGIIDFDLNGSGRSRKRRINYKKRLKPLKKGYSPDFESIVFGIKGKKPLKTTTGFESRPIISNNIMGSVFGTSKRKKVKSKKKSNSNMIVSVFGETIQQKVKRSKKNNNVNIMGSVFGTSKRKKVKSKKQSKYKLPF